MTQKELVAVCFGEVLWDIFGATPEVGGAPLNVCYHLSKHGVESHIISKVGGDEEGRSLLAELKRMGIDGLHCSISDRYPTSTVTVSSKAETLSYQINRPVAWDDLSADETLFPLVERSDVFVYGSLAAREAKTREALYAYLELANWKVFDVNLRDGHYTPEVILDLLAHADTLKVNEEELSLIGEWVESPSDAADGIISRLQGWFPGISEIIVTRGSTGASYFAGSEQITAPGVTVEVVDTVGCGDAFLAAFIAAKLREAPVEQCLEQAVQLSAFVATRQGGCPPYESFDPPVTNLRQ